MTKSILIVEDDHEQRALFVQACKTVGYHVVAVSNGTAALASAAHESFDLLLADLYLPGNEGDLVIREIKQRQPQIKAILMSGHCDIHEAAEMCPADQIYRKGDLHQLLSMLCQLVTPQYLHLQ